MRINELDYKAGKENRTNPDIAFNRSLRKVEANQAEWTTFEGVAVLRVKDSNYIGVPCTNRKNAAKFAIIDINDRTDIVCQLNKNEVYGWLRRKHIR